MFTDKELNIIKTVLTDQLNDWLDPSVSDKLAKEIAYLRLDKFDPEYADVVLPIQTALRKIIEEIIMRQVNESA